MKKINNSIDKRFKDIELNDAVTLSTFLDPQFKNCLFSGPDTMTKIKDTIASLDNNQNNHQEDDEIINKPSSLNRSSIWKFLEDIPDNPSKVPALKSDILKDFSFYSSFKRIGLTECPLKWWKENESNFPHLAKIAKKYLSAPPSSVFSERVFSLAGNIITERRSSLLSSKAEMLVFIKSNNKFF